SSLDRPSIVTISTPSACAASIRQERTATPSTITVQAPHTPCSQPTCVPVSFSSRRRQSARLVRGSRFTSTRSPFTMNLVTMLVMRVPSFRRATQRPLDQRFQQRATVGSRRVNVIVDLEIIRAERGPAGNRRIVHLISSQSGFALVQPHRRTAHADRADPWIDGLSLCVHVIEQGDASEREIALPSGEFFECPASVSFPGRQANADKEFIQIQSCRQRSVKKLR